MQSHLAFEGRRYVFSPHDCGFFFYHREVCLVSTNAIENHCSFQGFAVDPFFLNVIIVGCETFAQNIWMSTSYAITNFSFSIKKDAFFPGLDQARVVLFVQLVCTFFFGLTCKFTWQCAPMYWGEGDVWWGMCKGDALSMGWTRLLCFSIICIRVVHVI